MSTQPEALRLADALESVVTPYTLESNAAAELRRLHAENAALHQANEAFSKRQEWWNEKMFALEQQRGVLLEALRKIGQYTGEGPTYSTPWQDIVADLGQTARAAIKAVEGENHAKSI